MVAFDPKKFTPEEIAKGRRAVFTLNIVMAAFIVLPFLVWLIKKEVTQQSSAPAMTAAAAPAQMELRLVSPLDGTIPDAQIPPGYERLSMRAHHPSGHSAKAFAIPLIVKKTPEADSSIFGNAYLHFSAPAQPPQEGGTLSVRPQSEENSTYGVTVELTPAGQKQLADITRRIVEENQKGATAGQLAFVFEGTVYSAPIVRSVIDGPRIEFSGNLTWPEAEALLRALTAGKPPPPSARP